MTERGQPVRGLRRRTRGKGEESAYPALRFAAKEDFSQCCRVIL